jgi:hypothetical protein
MRIFAHFLMTMITKFEYASRSDSDIMLYYKKYISYYIHIPSMFTVLELMSGYNATVQKQHTIFVYEISNVPHS